MYKTVFLSRARQDVRKAASWYDKQQPGLGRRFTHAVRSKLVLIGKNPYLYTIRYRKTRTVLLRHFPFMIYFNIDAQQRIVVVMGV